MKTTTLILFSFLLISNVLSFELKKFETDGCTSFVDGTLENRTLWQHCCLMHDMKYWYGGDQFDQDKADNDLRSCVKSVASNYWAELIYLGVRSGHHSPIKFKYKWGWGWEEVRPMTKLNPDEKDYVLVELKKLPHEQKYIDQVNSEYFEKNY
jgi:hypothetical protein